MSPAACKQTLQVAPNVGALTVGQVVEGWYGPATVLHIEVSTWRFSEKPKHRLTFRDHDSGEEYTVSYHPSAPLIHNQELFFGLDPYHHDFIDANCPVCGHIPAKKMEARP